MMLSECLQDGKTAGEVAKTDACKALLRELVAPQEAEL